MLHALVFWPRGMWHLGSLSRDQSHTPCIGRQSLWISREIPKRKHFDLHYFHWLFSHLDGQFLKHFNCSIVFLTLLLASAMQQCDSATRETHPRPLSHPGPLHPAPPGCHSARAGLPGPLQRPPTGRPSYRRPPCQSCSSVHPIFSFLHCVQSLLSVSASLFLPSIKLPYALAIPLQALWENRNWNRHIPQCS